MLRKTKIEELECVLEIIEDGREFLRQQGINQWQYGSPCRETIINDINKKTSYVYKKSGVIVATAMLTSYDEDYENYSSVWLENSSYLAVHRLATSKKLRNQGIAREFMESIYFFAKSQNIKFLRIDTHLDNKIMRKFLSRFGFKDAFELLMEATMIWEFSAIDAMEKTMQVIRTLLRDKEHRYQEKLIRIKQVKIC